MGLVAFAASLLVGQSGALAASAEQGRVEFLKHGCWQCHGELGQGGVTGPKLAPGPIPFDALKNFVRTTDRIGPVRLSRGRVNETYYAAYEARKMIEGFRAETPL